MDDAALHAALVDAGAPIAPGALDALIAGVAAAPPGYDEYAWMRMLVDDDPAPPLRAALAARLLHAQRAATPECAPDGGQRLGLLRSELERRGLAGFVVPRQDEHQGEYVPACAERLAWLSGFTGSAGMAVVLAERAALFVDGRYVVQAVSEVDPSQWVVRHGTHEPLADWLHGVRAGSTIGFDPWLHTPRQVAALRTACAASGARVEAIADNPLDAVWRDRPPPPLSPVVPHASAGGAALAPKSQRIASVLQQAHEDEAVLTQPDAIAWLLDIRGADVPYTPVTLAFAIVSADGRVNLFIDARKLTRPARSQLQLAGVRVCAAAELADALDALGAAGRKVRVDPDTAPEWIATRLAAAGAVVSEGADPCALPKACKTPAEVDGMRAAHLRDGTALCRFLAWLSTATAAGRVTEIAAAEQLERFRQEEILYRGPSFHTISAAGSNGAIVHYRATPASNRTLEPGNLYLVDSGGQYPDGTTDVTRTVAIGAPTEEMRERFTLVLKGHIAVAAARFPRGTSGSQLDVLARTALWCAGLDYDHGTGHGVGCYLAVHEGPQRISKLPNRVALEPGMVVSDEPGFYRTGEYGIRIENLLTVVALGTPQAGEHELLGFETLTLAPLDPALVDWQRLSAGEIAWMNDYHARVREAIAPRVDAVTREWLDRVTRRFGVDDGK